MSMVSRWTALLARDPIEFLDRLRTVAQIKLDDRFAHRPAYQLISWADAIGALSDYFGLDVNQVLTEPQFASLESELHKSISNLDASSMPVPQLLNADRSLAHLCYLTCRILQPEIVLETGVGFGVSSSHFLAALEANGKGTLISVDLPPLRDGAEDLAGCLVPDNLRHRWDLRRGSVERVFKGLMPDLDSIDVFLHDSARSKKLMDLEFSRVHSRMRDGGVIIANSIERNSSFRNLVSETDPDFDLNITQVDKEGVTGICFYK